MRVPWLVVLGIVLAGCTGAADTDEEHEEPPAAPDPRDAGPHDWRRDLYDFGVLIVDDPSMQPYTYPVQVTGSIHSPESGGPHPLIVLMHGRHGTCAVLGGEIIFTHVCPNAGVITPVESFAGYDYLAENLASHGYVVASINANQINDRDLLGDAGANARGQLLLRTLDDLAAINATGAPSAVGSENGDTAHLQGRLDMDRIGVMGHSRGGQGMAKGLLLDRGRQEPFGIDAVMTVAPTDFQRYAFDGVPFATILPYCDGDVASLHGAWMFDNGRYLGADAPRMQFTVMGANHNFFNTVWTGSDYRGSDAHCKASSDRRLDMDAQTEAGLAIMAPFFRAHVGQEPLFARYMTGQQPLVVPDVRVSHHAGASHRDVLASFESDTVPERNAWDGTLSYRGDVSVCDAPGDCPSERTFGEARRLVLDGEQATIRASFAPRDLGAWDVLSLRIGVPYDETENGDGAQPSVILHDASGATSAAPLPWLEQAPGGDMAKVTLDMLAVPLDTFDVDLSQVTGVEVVFAGTGAYHVADLMVQRFA